METGRIFEVHFAQPPPSDFHMVDCSQAANQRDLLSGWFLKDPPLADLQVPNTNISDALTRLRSLLAAHPQNSDGQRQTERELAERLGLVRRPVRRALDVLETAVRQHWAIDAPGASEAMRAQICAVQQSLFAITPDKAAG